MASVFVPGPSVNPSLIGSPAQYLNQINDTLQARKVARVAEERNAQTKLFQDASLALQDRKLAFDEAAPQRTEDLRIANLGREVEKTETVRNLAQGAQFLGGNRLGEADIQKAMAADPRFKNLDAAGQLAATNKFILSSPSALTPPKDFAEALRSGMVQSGQFTGAEINAAVSDEVTRRYPTADKELLKSILVNPSDLLGKGNSTNFNVSIGKDGTPVFGGGRNTGTNSFVSDPVNQADKTTQLNNEHELIGLTKSRTKSTFGVRHELNGIPIVGRFFDKNVTRQNHSKAVAKLEQAGFSTESAISALRGHIDGDLESNMDFDNLSPTDISILKKEAADAALQQTQLLNSKGGGIFPAGQGGAAGVGSIFSPIDAVNAATTINERLLSRLTPQALSDSDLVTEFLNSIGPASTAGGGGGNTPPPDQVAGGGTTPPPPAGGTGSGADLPPDLSEAATSQPVDTIEPREITSRAAEAFVKAPFRAFNKIFPAKEVFENTAQPLVQRILDSTIGQTDLVPQQPRENTVIPSAVTNTLTQGAEGKRRLKRINDITGTGITRNEFESRLSPEQVKAYAYAHNVNTPEEVAVQIIQALRRGETPRIP
jgi:hypothetical protein